jgi:hypothetical protein
MPLKLVRTFGNPRQFGAKAGSRPTVAVRGRKGPVVLREVTLRGQPVVPQNSRAVTLDVVPGINTLRLLLDPFDSTDIIDIVEEAGDDSQILDCHRFDPADPVSGYRILGS